MRITQEFKVPVRFEVAFTRNVFGLDNTLLADLINKEEGNDTKALVIIDEEVAKHHLHIQDHIDTYLNNINVKQLDQPLIVKGGEEVKNDPDLLMSVLEQVNIQGIDRHSYIIAVGGGAVLDFAGLAAAVAHRGVRLIRIPTTVLSQNDSGVGVKNGINAFGKKNFIGTFAAPYAVINDTNFLTTLSDRDWRSGISEAIKVALIKDKEFFHWIEENIAALNARNLDVMEELNFKCAQLHIDHIGSGDPFESGSSRPLDFGHWSAHKLEQITSFKIKHGEAVAIGICLDALYSAECGLLKKEEALQIIKLFNDLQFEVFHPSLEENLSIVDHPCSIITGLNEFREHLGGQLTIMMLERIGRGKEVNQIDSSIVKKCIHDLRSLSQSLKTESHVDRQ